jgi:hypothetical protein
VKCKLNTFETIMFENEDKSQHTIPLLRDNRKKANAPAKLKLLFCSDVRKLMIGACRAWMLKSNEYCG